VTSNVVHFQFGARDADRLANFYREVFGWRVRDARLTSVEHGVSGPYRFISGDEAEASGGVTGEGAKGVILTVQVDDMAETVERAERLGGRRLSDVDAERLELEGAGGGR
jgi:predicted enzyme related to lactoylglutathione lyase